MLIAHISDFHIVAPPALCYDMVDTRAFLARLIDRLNRMAPRPDLVVATGDLVDEPSPAAYACLRAALATLDLPLILLPGNHDDRAMLAGAFPDHVYLPGGGAKAHFVREDWPVRIVALDAVVPGREYAQVDEADIDWLRDVLAQDRDGPAMLIMHHPPIVTGLAFMDIMQPPLDPAFEALIAAHPAIRLILCGHVHRAIDGQFGGARVATAPGAAHQFGFGIDLDVPPQLAYEPPLIRLHHWRGDDVTSFCVPVDDGFAVHRYPGVDERTWPDIARRMRAGASRAIVVGPSE